MMSRVKKLRVNRAGNTLSYPAAWCSPASSTLDGPASTRRDGNNQSAKPEPDQKKAELKNTGLWRVGSEGCCGRAVM
jgi:hypothetical protein